MRVWDYQNYREYLIERLGGERSRTGQKKKLAEFIPVHTTFVSQVLKGRAELSLEQAEAINTFFEHTEDEGEYFILLLLKDRSGTSKLKDRFNRKIKTMRDKRINIKEQLKVDSAITTEDREKFYSTYIYGAIHVLTSIQKFKTVEALASVLGVNRTRVQESVDFLLRLGVLQEQNGELSPGSQHIHLGNDTELILKHHSNWRFHAIQNLQFLNREDLHYSACISISEKDVHKVKESILQNLKDNVKIISESEEEVPYVLSFDFYQFTR